MFSCLFCAATFAEVDSTYLSHVLAGHPLESAVAGIGVAVVPAIARGRAEVAIALYVALAVGATVVARRQVP